MGKDSEPYFTEDFTFAPRINNNSRKLATQERSPSSRDDAAAVPRYMQSTVAHQTKCEIPPNITTTSSKLNAFNEREVMALSTVKPSTNVGKYSLDPQLTFSPRLNSTSMKIAKEQGPQLKVNIMNRAAAVAAKLAEENQFTFKPKVSSHSVKIAENLGTDFMSRQQQHLEKQRRYTEQAALQFKSPGLLGRLSPVNKQKKFKESRSIRDGTTSDGEDTLPASITPDGRTSPQTKDGSQVTNSASVPNFLSPLKPGQTKVRSTSIQRPQEGGSFQASVSLKRARSKPVAKRHSSLPAATEFTHSDSQDDRDDDDDEDDDDDTPSHISQSRSRTMPPAGGKPALTRKLTSISVDQCEKVRNAKLTAERAIKYKRVFTIHGPYPRIRESMRRRGWVEKFYKMNANEKKSPRTKRKKVNQNSSDNDDDDYDDDDDGNDTSDSDDDLQEGKTPPWEEDNGIYGIMSRIVRNTTPTFIWSVKREPESRNMRKETMVNHYGKAGSFTTKVGLCMNVRNTIWYDKVDPDTFFPRCYRLSHEEEKEAFVEDYRLLSCMNILKWVQQRHEGSVTTDVETDSEEKGKETDSANQGCTDPECTRSRPNTTKANKCKHMDQQQSQQDNNKENKENKATSSPRRTPAPPNSKKAIKKKGGYVPMKALDLALKVCHQYCRFRNHEDLDDPADEILTEGEWEQLIQWYYQLVHDGGQITHTENRLKEVEAVLSKLKDKWLQYDLDGMHNVWIVKPGAKSRGRGITCYNKLEDMLKLVNSSVVRKDSRFVVQKYMERPLLVYNTKFDIRQWFLVTDWNPLTIWWYKECYFRFCSQEYTLTDFNEAIHLSNNSIQKYYSNCATRSSKLPDDNMWHSDDFIAYLKERGHDSIWEDVINPGMKRAVICAILTTQDLVEPKKSAFELYGADFMVTDNFAPWLIEINSSPSMAYSTKVTEDMCSRVLEDTVRVVIDRKYDKNCDVGGYELLYRQQQVSVPPYIGINLSVDGQAVKKPSGGMARRATETNGDGTTRNSVNGPARISLSHADKILYNKQNVEKNQSRVAKTSYRHAPKPPPPKPDANWPQSAELRKSTDQNNNEDIPPLTPSQKVRQHMQQLEKNVQHTKLHRTLTPKSTQSIINGGSDDEQQEEVLTTGRQSVAKSPLPVTNVETTDLQQIERVTKGNFAAALIDGAWARTCNLCGRGMNLKLDDDENRECACQMDSIKMTENYTWGRKSQPPQSTFVRPISPIGRASISRPTSARNSVSAPARKIHIDGAKLMESVYTKTEGAGLGLHSVRPDKVLLRYTDGGIQRPTAHKPIVAKSLPRLVSRYMTRRKDGVPVYIDTYREGGKLSVVSHSFV